MIQSTQHYRLQPTRHYQLQVHSCKDTRADCRWVQSRAGCHLEISQRNVSGCHSDGQFGVAVCGSRTERRHRDRRVHVQEFYVSQGTTLHKQHSIETHQLQLDLHCVTQILIGSIYQLQLLQDISGASIGRTHIMRPQATTRSSGMYCKAECIGQVQLLNTMITRNGQSNDQVYWV